MARRTPLMSSVVAAILLSAPFALAQQPAEMKVDAPDFTGITEWINSKPLAVKDLKGQVMVLHFWTFGCINCIHNYPHLRAWHEKYAGKGVTVVGVHTAETAGEKKPERVRAKAKENKLDFPIAVDRDGKTWAAWNNRYWPATYLIDRRGQVRYLWYGELNYQGAKGEEVMRKKIDELLAEKE